MKTYQRLLNSDYAKNIFHIIIITLILVLIFGIAITSYPLNNNEINSEKNEVFKSNWQYSIDDGTFMPIVLPASEKGTIKSHLTLKNAIPQKIVKGATILLRTSQQNVKILIEDTTIYNSQEKDGKHMSSSGSFHFVRLPTDSAGKEITIILTSPYNRYAGLMNQIYIGSKASNIFFAFRDNGLMFTTGSIIFILGLIILCTFIFAKKYGNMINVIYLGAFFICAGFWVLSESKIAQFIIPYPMAVNNMGIFALTLLPVFLGLYCYRTYVTKRKLLLKLMILVVAIQSLTMAVTAIINPMLPLEFLTIYIIISGIYLIFMLTMIVFECIKVKSDMPLSFCGILIFACFSLLELIIYLLDTKSHISSNYLTFGLFLFCVVMLMELIQNLAKSYQATIKVSALTVLAYTDSLTGLKNRTAFLEHMSNVNINNDFITSITMFDINNLKMVNDSLGHSTGDEMIKQCVKVMENSIRIHDSLYRIGGDEFVAIVQHEQDFSQEIFEKKLLHYLNEENSHLSDYKLSIAYGYATFSNEKDKNIFSTLSRADERMYKCKKLQKGISE